MMDLMENFPIMEVTQAVQPSTFSSSRFFKLAVAALVVFTVTIVISTVFEESEIRRKGRQSGKTTILGDASYFSRRLGRTELNRDGLGLLFRGYENVGIPLRETRITQRASD